MSYLAPERLCFAAYHHGVELTYYGPQVGGLQIELRACRGVLLRCRRSVLRHFLHVLNCLTDLFDSARLRSAA